MTEKDPAFDEHAALAELERLRDAIHAARQARQRTSEEFDRFTKTFRRPQSDRGERDVPPAPAWEVPAAPALAPDATPEEPPADIGPPAVTHPVPAQFLPPPRSRGRLVGWAVAAAAVAAVASPLVMARWRRSPSPAQPAVAVARDVAPPPPAPAPPPQPPAADLHAVQIELRTIHPVWMRVVVDGEKKIEGVIAAGERLPFAADRSIVVRAGSGGDVVVKSGPREEPFGIAGQPLTRTFVKPDAANPAKD